VPLDSEVPTLDLTFATLLFRIESTWVDLILQGAASAPAHRSRLCRSIASRCEVLIQRRQVRRLIFDELRPSSVVPERASGAFQCYAAVLDHIYRQEDVKGAPEVGPIRARSHAGIVADATRETPHR
jgi:hypothetical protein